MSIKDKIRQYVENRRMEAVKKQVSHKLIMIARNLGQEMVSTNYQPAKIQLHPDIEQDDSQIMSMEDFDDWREYDIGFYFDGLRFGYNLCILCFATERKVTQIRVTFNGYIVFAELEGKLRAYAPFPLWENSVDFLYERAIMINKRRQDQELHKKREEKEKQLSATVYMLKRLWGY